MFGSLLIIPACLMIAGSAIDWAITGRITSPWFFIGISMVLVAVQAMGVGIVSLMLRRTELRTSRRLSKMLRSVQG